MRIRVRVLDLVSSFPSSKMLTTATIANINSLGNVNECVNGSGAGEELKVREAKLFNETFEVILKKLDSKIDPDLGPVSEWMRKVSRTFCCYFTD